jgi:hypothetical protein
MNTSKIATVATVVAIGQLVVPTTTTSFILTLLSLCVLFIAWCLIMENKAKYGTVTTTTEVITDPDMIAYLNEQYLFKPEFFKSLEKEANK